MTMHEDADAIEQQLEAELNKFAAEEAERLGLGREQWVEPVNTRPSPGASATPQPCW